MSDPFLVTPVTSRPRSPPLQHVYPSPTSQIHLPILAPRASAAGSSSASPPLTPTPIPSSSFPTANGTAPISAARIRAISPPTPAPSPQPQTRGRSSSSVNSSSSSSLNPSSGWRVKPSNLPTSPFFDPSRIPPSPLSEPDLIEHLRSQINALSPSARHALLSQLIHDSTAADLSTLLPLIKPRLKRDFLRTLPVELSFHVLSFMDDARSLARASAVSRFWRALLEDEATWKRMCWKSGFVPPASATVRVDTPREAARELESPTSPTSAGGAGVMGERLRTLEFGSRPDLGEDQLYTPAGRERRGTLDRASLAEFSERVFRPLDPPAPAAAGAAVGGRVSADAMGLGLGAFETPVLQAGAAAGAVGGGSGLAARRGQRGIAPVAVPPLSRPAGTENGSLDLSSFDAALPVASTSSAALPAQPERAQLVSPQMFALPTSSITSTPLSVSQSLHSLSSFVSPTASSLPPGMTSFPPPPPPASSSSSSSSSRPPPFSYKRHFKTAYLTQDAWLHGPGRLLSTQMSADDGVVTSMGFDDEWIAVGMATSKVHIFEAGCGTYVRTLEGHELGVWCLTLVSKGGGPRGGVAASGARGDDDESEDDWDGVGKGKGSSSRRFERPAASPMGTTFSQPGSSSLHPPAQNFFRDGATTPLAASFHSSPSSPSNGGAPSHPPPRPSRRRRSFPSSSATPPAPPSAASASSVPSAAEESGGGMGIGAGGTTGDASQQAGVCGTARGYGQKGALVVSGGCDRDVRVWDVETGRCLHLLRGHVSTVRCMRVLDGRPIAVSGSRDKTVRVWDIEKGVCLHVLNGHQLSVRCLEVSGNKVVSGSYDATCRLWDVDTGECLHVFRGHVHQIYAVAFDGIKVVTGSLDSTVRIWDAKTGDFLALLQGHTSLVGQLQLDPASNVLVTGGSDGRVLVFDLDTFEAKHVLQAHENSVTALQFDQRFIVTGSNDGKIKLWDFNTGHFIRELADPSDAVWRVVFRDDKCVTLCRRNDRTLMDMRTFRPPSPSGEGVVGGGGGGGGGRRG